MSYEIRVGDALGELAPMDAGSVQTCITSPPYFGLRDYGDEGQIGLEATPDEYVARLVEVFREVKRLLQDDGTLWLNLGDSYASSPPGNKGTGIEKWASSGLSGVKAGSRYLDTLDNSVNQKRDSSRLPGIKPKDLIGIPWMVAFALRADGWYLRSEIIWAKPNPMPESVTDRPTKAHEQVFLLSKSRSYFYDADAIREGWADERMGASATKSLAYSEESGRNGDSGLGGPPPFAGRNKRSVWTVATQPYPEAHFATFPPKLIAPMVLAGCPRDGMVLDPFAGSGTTLQVAVAHGRSAIGIELNPAYAALAHRRLEGVTPSMFDLEPAA